MISHHDMMIAILILFAMSFITRLLPLIFAKQIQQNNRLQAIGSQLPACIMLLLVIQLIQTSTMHSYLILLAQVVAVGLTVICQYWKRNVILSIFIGTATYLVLQWLII